MQQVLLARLDKIQQLEAEFAAEADIEDGAEAEAKSEATSAAGEEADTESVAAAGVHANAAPQTSPVGSAKPHASDMPAGVSATQQQGEISDAHGSI